MEVNDQGVHPAGKSGPSRRARASRPARHASAALRHWARSRIGIATIILVIAAVVALLTASLAVFPGRTLVMATGPEGDAYAVMAERFREVLARDGVDLKLRRTNGSIENVALLNDPASAVDVAFEQADTTTDKASPGVESLGTMFYEPLWFFCRCEARGKGLQELPGKRISIGPQGGGSRALTLQLLEWNAIAPNSLELADFSPKEAARRLRSGELDGAAFVSGWDSPVVRELLADPSLSLLDFPRADAYVARAPFLHKVKVPEGVGNLAANRPTTDVYLLAPKASLLVRRDVHHALQFLLLQAAREIHARASIFNAANEFPAAEAIDVPLSATAQSFYKSGPNFLQRNLPFWLASFVERALFVLLPIIGIAYPLFRLAPAIYRWEMRHRVLRLYGMLLSIETRARATDSAGERAELLRELASLESRIASIWMPRGFSDTAYELKMNVQYVRDLMESAAKASSRPDIRAAQSR
jgi:TRAP transporter TAXI family solute receptor